MHKRFASMATGYVPFANPAQGPPPPAVGGAAHRPRPPLAQRPSGFGMPPRGAQVYLMPHNMASMPYGGYYMPYVE